METSPHCTVSPAPNLLRLLWLFPLTVGVLLVQGYHPWAEDGGLYLAGVEYLLDPKLFPEQTAFVTEHLRYSVFAPLVAASVRWSHLSLSAVLFTLYLLSTALMLYAALRVADRCLRTRSGQWTAVSLLAAWWTMPVAGTSLLLMDPYVTARSLSTPLSLLAIGAALDPWSSRKLGSLTRPNPAIVCSLALIGAALFHPLMAGYALGLVLLLRFQRLRSANRWFATMSLTVMVLATLLQATAKPEPPPVVLAAYSRYYWFLSQWQWYEWLGLLGPVLIFAALLRWRPAALRETASLGCKAGVKFAWLSLLVALCLGQRHFHSHRVAGLQPLRAFLPLYAFMIVLLGGAVAGFAERLRIAVPGSSRLRLMGVLPGVFIAAMALTFYGVQRASFPASLHVETPGRVNPNPWVQAFLWAREHTPNEALFALDARYVNLNGEDAQTFRALAERSALPDFSKDGGEAAIAPALASEWLRGAAATKRLSDLGDDERDNLLRPFGVHWMVLRVAALTHHPCPYRNNTVKVCSLP